MNCEQEKLLRNISVAVLQQLNGYRLALEVCVCTSKETLICHNLPSAFVVDLVILPEMGMFTTLVQDHNRCSSEDNFKII